MRGSLMPTTSSGTVIVPRLVVARNPEGAWTRLLGTRKPMKATWNGAVLAESEDTVVVEGNHYFPAAAIRREHFRSSDTHTTCPWKGVASYYDVVVEGNVNKDAAWYYPETKEAAKNITGRVAFWKGVKVEA
jgi:uncharacterized protein (DUF427 family)